MMVTIQLPDGTYALRHINALQPDDMIVFGGCETRAVEYAPPKMDWDFDDGSQPPEDKTIVYVGGFGI